MITASKSMCDEACPNLYVVSRPVAHASGHAYGNGETGYIRQVNVCSQCVTTIAGSRFMGTFYSKTSATDTSYTTEAEIHDGIGTNAVFNAEPLDMVMSPDGTKLYVATQQVDTRIRVVDLATKQVSTIAGRWGASHTYYQVGYGYQSGKWVAHECTSSYTVCPDGVGTNALFGQTSGITATHDALYISDTGNGKIRRLDLATMNVTTVAGDPYGGGRANGGYAPGEAFTTRLGNVRKIAATISGSTIIVANDRQASSQTYVPVDTCVRWTRPAVSLASCIPLLCGHLLTLLLMDRRRRPQVFKYTTHPCQN